VEFTFRLVHPVRLFLSTFSRRPLTSRALIEADGYASMPASSDTKVLLLNRAVLGKSEVRTRRYGPLETPSPGFDSVSPISYIGMES
jgi:hypothetical protein